MFAAAPPEIVPMLNVVLPNLEVDGQCVSSRELRHEMRCSMAETPSSGYPPLVRLILTGECTNEMLSPQSPIET